MGDKIAASPNGNHSQEPHFVALGGEESLSTLTFDDVPTNMANPGKPLNCMNLDELVRATSSGEGPQRPNPSSSASVFLGNFNLNETLDNKVGDEIWGEIVGNEHVGSVNNQSLNQQIALGETTLEDFLVRAGVINLDVHENPINQQPVAAADQMAVVSQPMDWVQLHMASISRHQQLQQQQQQQPLVISRRKFDISESGYENQGFEGGYSENQLALPSSAPAISATSPLSQAGSEKKPRHSDEVMDKSMERRQKRMIKNRESAARSRARKQAYTNQLEREVLHLRKTNNWLRKQKEVELLLYSESRSGPEYQLRRTSSSLF